MRKKKDDGNRKSSTRSRRSATGIRINRVLALIMLAAAIKLGVIAFIGVSLRLDAMTPQFAAVAEAEAAAEQPKPAAQPESKPAAKPEEPKGQAAQAKPQAAQPAEPPADWNLLRAKEEELSRKEQSLAGLEKELDVRLAKLQALESQIKKMLDEAKVVKDQKLQHLVEVYTNMKAKQAAQVLETLDSEIAVKILAEMKGKQAGEILSSVDPKKAAKLSEALTKLQMPMN